MVVLSTQTDVWSPYTVCTFLKPNHPLYVDKSLNATLPFSRVKRIRGFLESQLLIMLQVITPPTRAAYSVALLLQKLLILISLLKVQCVYHKKFDIISVRLYKECIVAVKIIFS